MTVRWEYALAFLAVSLGVLAAGASLFGGQDADHWEFALIAGALLGIGVTSWRLVPA